MVLEAILDILQILLFPGIFFCLALALFYSWIDRKYHADLQNRMGPTYTGWRGILQPFADFIKLMAKEDITPAAADRRSFAAVPIILLAVPLTALLLIPISSAAGIISFPGDIVFLMFLSTIIAILIFLGGWFSTNVFSDIGATRAVLQLIGYEIPFMIAVFSPAILAGSLTLAQVVQYQAANGWMLFQFPAIYRSIPMWIAFGIYMIALMAELEKIPLDIPEAETEIVAGWQTEYSGKKFAFLVLSNDLHMLFGAGLAVTLFLGGPFGIEKLPGLAWLDAFISATPVVREIWYTIWFILKTAIIVLIISNIRTLFARYRVDQMIRGSWKYLAPLALVQVMIIQLVSLI
ncbi:MAG: NADH-quinone oxidoreductase subunit H [Promethearchaeota archaeon]